MKQLELEKVLEACTPDDLIIKAIQDNPETQPSELAEVHSSYRRLSTHGTIMK